jgi:DNA-binding response OmpR family regulator
MISPCTILIVDDEQDLLEMYLDFFEMENFKVFSALSAKLGLEILAANPDIQVIISDSHMHGMSGLEFLNVLFKQKSSQLFYLATGDLDQSDEEIKKLNGTGLLLKPFDMNEVIKRILKDLNGTV